MVIRGKCRLLILFILGSTLGMYSGCELPLGANEGRLDIRINSVDLVELDWIPGTDVKISYYEVTLLGPDEVELVQRFPGDVSTFSFTGLPSGVWDVDIRGYSKDGELLAYLARNSAGSRSFQVRVFRAHEVVFSADMISIMDGTGSLEVSVDWSSLGLKDAEAVLALKQVDGDERRGSVLHEQGFVTFHDLPGGVYQIVVVLNDDPQMPPYWEGVYYAFVRPGDLVTTGIIVITEHDGGLGDVGVIIGESSNQIEVRFDWDIYPVMGDERVTFISQETYDNPTYLWYVNGQMLGADDHMTYEFSETGIYRVVLLVMEHSSSSGFLLGGSIAIMNVRDELPQIGDAGPGGGVIFYDKGKVSDQWRFLEAADEDLRYPEIPVFSWSSVNGQSAGTSTEIGAGYRNVERILAQEGHESSAAWQSTLFAEEHFTDWFLPSRDELQLIYQERHAFSAGFRNDWYWSSSEDGAGNAWAVDFTDGTVSSQPKDEQYRIRVIRSF